VTQAAADDDSVESDRGARLAHQRHKAGKVLRCDLTREVADWMGVNVDTNGVRVVRVIRFWREDRNDRDPDSLGTWSRAADCPQGVLVVRFADDL
jgi:hypothetical protein